MTWRAGMMLVTGPLLFLLAIVGVSTYGSLRFGGDPGAISGFVTGAIPQILLTVQVFLFLIFWIVLRAEGLTLGSIGWNLAGRQSFWSEALIGALPGVILALLYFSVLSPLMIWAQRVVGDYVPPGELVPALGTAAVPFFLANVILAPFVEESVYRGYGITALRERFTLPVAVVLSCVFFGLLHWAGGFWYILLTGIVAGGLFAVLFVWRKNIVAPFGAHLALNLVEFLYIWLRISGP